MRPLRGVVLLSGGGRTLQSFLDHGVVEVALVIGSRPDAFGLERARRAGVPWLVARRKDFADDAAYTGFVFSAARQARADLVLLAGFLSLLCPIPDDFRGRTLNIHPALIPGAFCGKGYYGDRVHEAVLKAGATETGCTVHLVDDEYDHGEVLVQRRVPVLPGDDAHALADRVFQAELEAYPEAIRLIAERLARPTPS
jgi:phosphoribosylglycinamide formyltransferase 1